MKTRKKSPAGLINYRMKKTNHTFLIVGLGSMGKRRIRNLRANNQRRIIGYDVRLDRRRQAAKIYGIETINDIKKISAQDFDVMLICASPGSHGDYIRMALKNKKHFFVEHPVNIDGYKEIFKDKNSRLVKAPSCTMRFYQPIKMIKEILERGKIGKVLTFQYHMALYLPDWHTHEDYRKVYFSKKETGACREMLPFELIWLNWIMNSKVAEISGYIKKVSDLRMDADDTILANIKYKNGILGNVMIDVISRKPFRTLRILCSDGVLEWERFEKVIKLYNDKTKTTKIIKIPKGRVQKGYEITGNEEQMYNDEIKTLLQAINGQAKYPHTFLDSQDVLKTLYALEKSYKTGKKIKV